MGIIRKLKEIDPLRLNRIRFRLFLFTYLFFIIGYGINMNLEVPSFVDMGVIKVSFGLFIILLILLLFKRDTIDLRFKKTFSYVVIITGLFALVIEFIDTSLYFNLPRGLYWSIVDIVYATLICEIIILYITFIHKVGIILPGLIAIILIGLVLNRVGLEDEAGAILIFAFFLLTVSILYVGFQSFNEFRDNKFMSRLLFFLGFVLAICSTNFVVKFSKWEAAHTSSIDFLGAIVYLLACLILFSAMPFSNFIEWTKRQKRFFFRLVLLPMVFFLIMFSLKFLLPGSSYQKLFFKGFSEKERTFFEMEEYTLEEEQDAGSKKD